MLLQVHMERTRSWNVTVTWQMCWVTLKFNFVLKGTNCGGTFHNYKNFSWWETVGNFPYYVNEIEALRRSHELVESGHWVVNHPTFIVWVLIEELISTVPPIQFLQCSLRVACLFFLFLFSFFFVPPCFYAVQEIFGFYKAI